jgi:transposase-like protein
MASDLIGLSALLDDAKCFDLIRQHRWPDGVRCPSCDSGHVVRNGWDDGRHTRPRWLCKECKARFDDQTLTVLAGQHQPRRIWVLWLYVIGLNLSNRQIAQELALNAGAVQAMTGQLRQRLVEPQPDVRLEGEIEADEVYVVAGPKGNPAAVQKKVAGGVGGA